VHAVDAGVVAHVGIVAGRGTVTVVHASGLRSTYEPVSARVRPGERVGRGTVLGALAVNGSHCAPAACLHLGAIRAGEYLDPLPLLEGRGVRLLPLRTAAGTG
jgi:murein DD-endopeptidase MepM/ murein hydrolase activator NlpD